MPFAATQGFHIVGEDPPPITWSLFENLPAPTLPAREPGESEQRYRARLAGFDSESGRRARPRPQARHLNREGSRGPMSG